MNKPIQYEILTDAWRYLKPYVMCTDEKEFKKLIDSFSEGASDFCEKFDKCKFAKEIILACMNEIDSIWKERYGKHG